jgi:starch phosphorylase
MTLARKRRARKALRLGQQYVFVSCSLQDMIRLEWDEAWRITTSSFAYTNHTLLRESLETWPVEPFQKVLPRHLEIIYEINARFLDDVRARFITEPSRLERLSLIAEGGRDGIPRVRMAQRCLEVAS